VAECLEGERPDVVMNGSAYNDVDGAESDWQGAFLVNGIGVKNLALACRNVGAVLVHFSTDYVFDGQTDRPYTIGDMPNPVNTYGQSKLLGEEFLREHGDRYYLIRTSWVFGSGVHSFPLKVCRWARERHTLRMVEDQVSSPTSATDLARATLLLIRTEQYGLYHVTNSGPASRYQWAEVILNAIGWDGSLEPARSDEFPSPARRPSYSVLDNFPLLMTIGETLPPWQEATERFLREKA
jgi:dTDP-4-dehydrorhamnose reductase